MKQAGIVVPFLVLLLLSSSTAYAATSMPVTGTFANGTFTGTFELAKFALDRNGDLVAVGVLKGTLTQAGTSLGSVVQTITLPVDGSGSCSILHLELGPLDLNLLGLMVHLNQIVLDVSAQSGSGNLLGNLLCAIAGLLDSPNQTLVNLLNQLLQIIF
jgi:hypothetical protein